eukprot:2287321-Prymnesium_polylepis.1
MNLRGSVSHPFRSRSIPDRRLGRNIPFLGGAKWTRSEKAMQTNARSACGSVSKRTHPGSRASTNYPLRKTSKWARN